MRFILFSALCLSLCAGAQDRAKALEHIKILGSEQMAGRGYVKDGDRKAAEWIDEEYKKLGLLCMGSSYFQELSFPVNSFPGRMQLKVDGKELKPGVDYIVNPGLDGFSDECSMIFLNESTFREGMQSTKAIDAPENRRYKRVAIVLDTFNINLNEEAYARHLDFLINEYTRLSKRPAIVIKTSKKLTWSVSTNEGLKEKRKHSIELLRSSIDAQAASIHIRIKNKFIKEHKASNVTGYIKGSEKPDSFIVFTAHYDHLGMMGPDAMFPGANDNASGIAMLLDLASEFMKKKPRYSVAFIAFCGEEAGLIGSKYYVEHPLFPLKQIRFLINLDLMGSGEDGIMAVNATEFEKEFSLLQAINDEKKYLSKVASRGKARNSDHYWFTEAGVPSFFFYLMGAYSYYHDVNDKPENLKLDRYDEAYRLIRDFAEGLMK